MTRLILLQVARTALAVIVVGVLGTYAFVVFGGSAHAVNSASMKPALRVGDVLVARPTDGRINPGQIILIASPDVAAPPVSHRVLEVLGDGTLVTMGDASAEVDPPVPPSWVQGEGVASVPWLGLPTVWLRERNLPALVLTAVFLGLLTWAATRPLSPVAAPAADAEENEPLRPSDQAL